MPKAIKSWREPDFIQIVERKQYLRKRVPTHPRAILREDVLPSLPGMSASAFARRLAKGGGEFFSITSNGNASKMFTAFDKGINWANPDRTGLIALAASYGQVVSPQKSVPETS